MKSNSPWFFAILFVVLTSLLMFFFYTKELKNIRTEKVTAWTEDVSGDCAVVLTGGRGRIKDGMSLLSRGTVRKLIISGVYEKASLRDIFPEWPYYGEMSPDDVILEKFSQTTYGNALQTLTIIEALKCRDLVLITSQSHMYRASKTFEAIFPKNYKIIKRSVYATESADDYAEALKSLFYSAWVY